MTQVCNFRKLINPASAGNAPKFVSLRRQAVDSGTQVPISHGSPLFNSSARFLARFVSRFVTLRSPYVPFMAGVAGLPAFSNINGCDRNSDPKNPGKGPIDPKECRTFSASVGANRKSRLALFQPLAPLQFPLDRLADECGHAAVADQRPNPLPDIIRKAHQGRLYAQRRSPHTPGNIRYRNFCQNRLQKRYRLLTP